MDVILQVTIKFQLPPTCEIALLISNLVSHLGVKVEEHGTGSDMTLRAWDRFVPSIKSFTVDFSVMLQRGL